MIIKKVPINKLNPAQYNPRKDLQHDDIEYQKLEKSINEFGCVQLIVLNERTGNIVGGHQTFKILIDNGATEVDACRKQKNKAEKLDLDKAISRMKEIDF